MKKYTYSALIALLTAAQALVQAAPVENSQPSSQPSSSPLGDNNVTVTDPKDGDVVLLHPGQGLSVLLHDSQNYTSQGDAWSETDSTWFFDENSNTTVLATCLYSMPVRYLPISGGMPSNIITPRVWEFTAVASGQAVLTFEMEDSYSGHGPVAIPDVISITPCHITVNVVE